MSGDDHTRPVQATPRRRASRSGTLDPLVGALPRLFRGAAAGGLDGADLAQDRRPGVRNPPLWLFTPQWHNYVEVLTLVPFQRYILNTATIVGFVVLGTLLSCSFCAYGFARLRAPGRNAIFFVLMATLMLPTTVTLVPTYIVFNNLGWLNTFKPLILPAFFGSAFFIFLFRQFFLGIPKELEEAARIDGAGYLRIWWTIFLPLSWPVIATVSVFTFVGAYNDFFGPVIYLSDCRACLASRLFRSANMSLTRSMASGSGDSSACFIPANWASSTSRRSMFLISS